MNELVKQLAVEAGVISSEYNGFDPTNLTASQRKFAELIVDMCCLKLLDMHDKTKGQHNYYKHAALEVKRYLGT